MLVCHQLNFKSFQLPVHVRNSERFAYQPHSSPAQCHRIVKQNMYSRTETPENNYKFRIAKHLYRANFHSHMFTLGICATLDYTQNFYQIFG